MLPVLCQLVVVVVTCVCAPQCRLVLHFLPVYGHQQAEGIWKLDNQKVCHASDPCTLFSQLKWRLRFGLLGCYKHWHDCQVPRHVQENTKLII